MPCVLTAPLRSDDSPVNDIGERRSSYRGSVSSTASGKAIRRTRVRKALASFCSLDNIFYKCNHLRENSTMNGLISSLYGQRGSEAAELLYSPSVVQSNCSVV